MSRVGKLPVAIPSGVTVSMQDGRVAVKGPKGQLAWTTPDDIFVNREGDQRLIRHRDEWLGHGQRDRAQARPLSCREDDRFHSRSLRKRKNRNNVLVYTPSH